MEIMVRATLTVQRKKRTVEKCYGFAPDAGEKLMQNYGRRLSQAQAVAIMGISRTKFRTDRDKGMFRAHGDDPKKIWYKGKDLYQYWWDQTRGECDEEIMLTGLAERERKLREVRDMMLKKI